MKTLFQSTIRLTALVAIVTLTGCLSSGGDDAASISSIPPPSPPPPPPPPGNSAPTISGVPGSSALIEEQYSFTPFASDADNDPLTFAVNGEPNWLSIDSDSGALTGTPTIADVGTYPGIVVSVSDGSQSASLPQFVVNVVQNADGSVTLSWTAPTENDDGSALTDLAGYKIYYGTSSGDYPNQVPINNASINTYVIDNLTPDTYYFVATSFNTSGVESRLSQEAVQTLN